LAAKTGQIDLAQNAIFGEGFRPHDAVISDAIRSRRVVLIPLQTDKRASRRPVPLRRSQAVMDRSVLARTLRDMLEQETGERFEHLDEQVDRRQELKLDSVDLVSLLLQIETRLNVKVGSVEVEKAERVGDLLDLLEVKLKSTAQAA
jgi:acyl carrier protein